jgi:hypothetical protein
MKGSMVLNKVLLCNFALAEIKNRWGSCITTEQWIKLTDHFKKNKPKIAAEGI